MLRPSNGAAASSARLDKLATIVYSTSLVLHGFPQPREVARIGRWLIAALLVCGFAACSTGKTPTETIVLVNAEHAVRAATVQLHLVVAGNGTGAGHLEQTITPKWPTALALVPAHADASRSYSVTAEALAADHSVVASARLISGYVKDQRRYVVLLLEDACLGIVCEATDASCHAGACQSAQIKPGDLGDAREKAPLAGTLVSGGADAAIADAMPSTTRDAGTDAGSGRVSDAASARADAGTPSSDAGAAGNKDNGVPCTSSDECASQKCVDRFCCKTACDDACSACNVAGSEGTCSAVPDGDKPATGHATCSLDDASTCQHDGTCDGKGACRLYLGGTACGPSSCDTVTNLYTAPSTCDGKGQCMPGSTLTCAPFVCRDATACFEKCTSGGAECSPGNVCTNTSCGLKGNGAGCAVDGECKSTHCADRVCCDDACTDTCKTCNQSATLGMCTVNPTGTDPRSECPAATGADAFCSPGQCNASGACKRTMTGTVCQAAKCVSGSQTDTGTCSAAGVCQIPASTACAPYICGPTACANPCQQQADCLPGYYCNTGSCISCTPTSASNPVYVDPVNGADNTSHGAQPAQCAYKTLTFALAHATGTINLLNTGSYTGGTETYPLVLSASQVVNCDPNNTGTKAHLILPNTGATTAVQLNGTATKLLNCDVSATTNAADFSACVTIGGAGAVTIDNCTLHDCSPSVGLGVSGGGQNGAVIRNSLITGVSNCFNQMGDVTISNIQCNCGNDWINGCGTLSGSGNCATDPANLAVLCNGCSCPGGFFTTPLMCP